MTRTGRPDLRQPRILITTTTWWPSSARLAIAFGQHGAVVSVVCPGGNPVHAVPGLRACHPYRSTRPLASLRRAIGLASPDLVVPTDDRSAGHLHALHRDGGAVMRALIERSLGVAGGYAPGTSRFALLEQLRRAGLPAPAQRVLADRADVRRWVDSQPGPWVLKAEESWGGAGVVLADTAQDAVRGFTVLSRPLPLRHGGRMALVERDPFPLRRLASRRRRQVVGQAYVPGTELTVMAASWRGQVLATVTAQLVQRQGRAGAATVVRLRQDAPLAELAGRVAAVLNCSGFFGLDVMLDPAGTPMLLEVNPRATQLGHLPVFPGGPPLAGSLLHALARDLPVAAPPVQSQAEPPPAELPPVEPCLALFPQALRFGTGERPPAMAELDVPWAFPDLVRELLRRPWSRRGLLARLEARLRPNAAYGSDIDPAWVRDISGRLAGDKC